VVLLLVGGGMVASAAPASAGSPPDDPDTLTSATLTCPAPIGQQDITVNSRPQDSPLYYLRDSGTAVPKVMSLSDGRVAVLNGVRQEYGLYSITLVSTDEMIGHDDTNTGSESYGPGPAGRLVQCAFHLDVEWTGVLDAELATLFEVDDVHVGSDVHISIDLDSTVSVIVTSPGR
jgi:hypothetical protein